MGAELNNSDCFDPFCQATGAAYIFQRLHGSLNNWVEVTRLVAPDATGASRFGSAVAIDGNRVLVGNSVSSVPGSAYIFQRHHGGDRWGYFLKLTASDAEAFDFFGTSVALSGATATVGSLNGHIGGAAYLSIMDGPDCNLNGVPDACDIQLGTSVDVDESGIPDECEADCNENGRPDVIDLIYDPSLDCNGNNKIDQCDIAQGISEDSNEDGLPDECHDVDCNGNGVSDVVDVTAETSADCNKNFVPDDCEINGGYRWDGGIARNALGYGEPTPIIWGNQFDAGGGAVISSVAVAFPDVGGLKTGDPVSVFLWDDPNNDGRPDDVVLLRTLSSTIQTLNEFWDEQPEIFDSYDIPPVAVTGSFFVGVTVSTGSFPIAIEDIEPPLRQHGWVYAGSDTAAFRDAYENFFGSYLIRAGELDCNGNGVPDACDIADGTRHDTDGDGVPDGCDSDGEIQAEAPIHVPDLIDLISCMGLPATQDCRTADLNGDGAINVLDLTELLLNFRMSQP